MGKRGPQPSGQAMSNAERQRRYRERMKARHSVKSDGVLDDELAKQVRNHVAAIMSGAGYPDHNPIAAHLDGWGNFNNKHDAPDGWTKLTGDAETYEHACLGLGVPFAKLATYKMNYYPAGVYGAEYEEKTFSKTLIGVVVPEAQAQDVAKVYDFLACGWLEFKRDWLATGAVQGKLVPKGGRVRVLDGEDEPESAVTGDGVSAINVIKKALCQDWGAVALSLVNHLGFEPTQIDPANYTLTYSFGGKTPTFCIRPRNGDATIAMVKWAADNCVSTSYDERYRNWQVSASDPMLVVNTFFPSDIEFKGNEIVCSENLGKLKYTLIPAFCPHAVKVSKNRSIKMHKKWVRDSAKEQWGCLTTYGEVTYYFQREEDAVLAKMFIGS